MHITRLNDAAALADLQPEWRALAVRASNASTFLTPEWLLSWLEAYQPTTRVAGIAVCNGDELLALAPLMLKREKQSGIVVDCLRFIGDGSGETDHMDFVIAADCVERPVDLILREIETFAWDVAVFCNVPETSPTCNAIVNWARRNRMSCRQTVTEGPIRSLPRTFEELVASMPSRFRTSVRSTRRKLAASFKVEFGTHDEPTEFNAALETLFANHESRWKARGQDGVFVSPDRRRFYRTLTQRLHDAGDLRFFYLKLDGRIVAQEFCFQHQGTVYLLQEGFDYALAKGNIGNALRSHVFEYLIDNGYKAYDFLGGVTRHKLNWSDNIVRDVTITVGRPTWRGIIATQLPAALERAKSMLRPIRDRLLRSAARSTGAPPSAGKSI
jgi:CelD/BcsL family acetyltransferase involved in cellulose biosynthesis